MAAAGSREVEWHRRELGGPPSRKGQPDDFKHAWLDLDVNNNLQKGRAPGASRGERPRTSVSVFNGARWEDVPERDLICTL